MKTTLALVAFAMLSPMAALQAAKPNILHIHADDHRPDGLRALGKAPLTIANPKPAEWSPPAPGKKPKEKTKS